MTEFCDQLTSAYLSTTAQHIKPLNRSFIQIYTLRGFSLSSFEIITQPFPRLVWRQPAATSSASKEQNPEQPWISARSGATLRLSLREPGGSCRQTLLCNKLGCHRGGACADLGHLWINTRNRNIKDLMANHQIQHHPHTNESPDWPTCTRVRLSLEPIERTCLRYPLPFWFWAIILIPRPQCPSQTSY